MIETENRITIKASVPIIFALAQDVGRWPDLLAHYRYVRVLEEDAAVGRRLVRMGARRGLIPVRWTAEQLCMPEAGIIEYRHRAGLTRGMIVEWRTEHSAESRRGRRQTREERPR